MPGRRRLRDAMRALSAATTYAEWRDAAETLDALTGADAWRAEPDCPFLHADLMQQELDELRSLREQGRAQDVARLLHDTLIRNLGDLSSPGLYETALAGTKHLVTDYLDEVERALRWLCDTPFPEIPIAAKLSEFRRAARVFGRSALVLSGGATLGFHHLGVVKALFDQDLLPDVISGASTGAMIAAGVCTRTDDELREMFAHPERIRRDGLRRASLAEAWRQRALLRGDHLHEVLRDNCGSWTFEEAWRRSGRVLNISVSPTRTRQKPRLLCHLTAPDVLVTSGALASSALPGLFPPVVLERRTPDGAIVPYVPSERWIDGSMRQDLPMRRLARLHGVNHFIVSQTNPHVVPFVAAQGGVGFALGLIGHSARVQGAHVTEVLRRVTGSSPLRPVLDAVHALADQTYRGDIDLHPRFRPRAWLRMIANPTLDELRAFILEGQRATWPRIAQIRDQTRIGRVLRECVRTLEAAQATPPTAQGPQRSGVRS